MDRIWSGACIGNFFLEKFDPENMIFLKWLNSFEYLLEYSKTENGDKSKCLLHMVEDSLLNKIKKNVYPSDPYKLSYDDLITFLENTCSHFQGKEAANFRYLLRCQLPNESVDHYALALRKLYNKCTPNVQRMINLTNQFIKGLANPEIRTLLKEKENISFATAICIAIKMELAKKNKTRESTSK
ncbi:hypothetical protein M0804_013279 [Polistes exclamans]|nr:hypothetical protein M0804_013279 [Polistes exclamans]